MPRALARSLLAAAGLGVCLLSGCGVLFQRGLPPDAVRPTVAVSSFENRSNFPGQWELGDGMADLLVSELVRTAHFEVLERQHLDPVVGEMELQSADLFRDEGKVRRGQLKNARYLIRGVITDFTHVSGGSTSFISKMFSFGASGYTAQVSLTITIVDVETGRIVASVQSDGKAKAGESYVEARYSDVAFGGDAFFRTPLGKATVAAIRESVEQISDTVEIESWTPMIAAASTDYIVVNGGRERGVLVGAVYTVREQAQLVTDPQTGDVITALPGAEVGGIRVVRVEENAAFAEILFGEGFRRGQWLEPANQGVENLRDEWEEQLPDEATSPPPPDGTGAPRK